MAQDSEAQLITLNYDDGSITMPVGSVRDLFGDAPPGFSPKGEEKDVSVKGHSRTRVIGGASSSVSAYSYKYTQWPVGSSGNSKGGEPILMRWENSEGWWTARMSGSAWNLGKFLKENSFKPVSFKTQRGTPYGPFAKTIL